MVWLVQRVNERVVLEIVLTHSVLVSGAAVLAIYDVLNGVRVGRHRHLPLSEFEAVASQLETLASNDSSFCAGRSTSLPS